MLYDGRDWASRSDARPPHRRPRSPAPHMSLDVDSALRHLDRMVAAARALSGNHADADDLVQDVYLSLHPAPAQPQARLRGRLPDDDAAQRAGRPLPRRGAAPDVVARTRPRSPRTRASGLRPGSRRRGPRGARGRARDRLAVPRDGRRRRRARALLQGGRARARRARRDRDVAARARARARDRRCSSRSRRVRADRVRAMEVLSEVDGARIAELRKRDEFFWLDLDSPSDADLDAAGELLGLHELALEDTREFDQRPKIDRYPERVLLVYWTAYVTPNRLGGRAGRGAPAHLRRLPVHGPARAVAGARRRSATSSSPRTERRGVHRLSRARRPHRRAVPGRRPPRGAHRRARGGGAARHRPAPARRDLPAQAGRSSRSSASSSRSATSSPWRSRRSSRCPA